MIKFDNPQMGGQTLVPYIIVHNGDEMLEFYKKAFGAEVLDVARVPDSNKIMNAQLKIGNGYFMLNDEFPEHGGLSPNTTGTTSSSIHIMLSEGIDELYHQALAAGATGLMDPADMFWGDRFAMLVDPSGHRWMMGMPVATAPQWTDDQIKDSLSKP